MNDPTAPSDAAPFGIWEQLRTAVRASPDHLSATAERLVAAKDPRAIFEFVRDQIVAYPSSGNPISEVRWGVRGTLRGGAGTAREKAELLVALYQRAGFDAKVVVGYVVDTDPDHPPAERAFLRTIIREFAPSVDEAKLATWKTEMSKVGSVVAPMAVDPDDSERSALVASISALLPPDLAQQIATFGANKTVGDAGLNEIPLVAVTVDEQTRYANPLFAEANFGDSLTNETPEDAPAASPAPDVVVELFVSTTGAPTKRISVAKGTYPADTLAGRQVMVQFAPATDIASLSQLRISDIHSFKPVISVRGQDVDPDADPSFVVVGPQITVRGDIIETEADGSVNVNGRQLFAATDVNPDAEKQVTQVSVELRPGGFPYVNVVVSALDSAGNAVSGLPASAFGLLEGVASMGFLESATPSDTLRVFLTFDLDDPLGSGEDSQDFARQLTTAVLTAYPNAVIVTGLDGTYVERTDPDAVAAAVLGGDSDDTWSDLAIAAAADPTLVVVVSDFWQFADPTDPTSTKRAYVAIVAGGPPVVAISIAAVGSPTAPEVDKLAALTSGVVVPNGGIADSIQAVLDLLAKQKAGSTYTLKYKAPIDGPKKRNVQVTVNQITGDGSYTVPSTQAEATALAGIYLSVSIGDDNVTRVLGGYREQNPPDSGVSVEQSVLDDVTNALFAVNLLSFEAAAPTLSQYLDDLLSSKLAIQPLWEAVAANDSKTIQASIAGLRTYVPRELSELQCPLTPSTATSSTYENRLRVVLCSHRPQFGIGHQERVDVLPLGDTSGGWLTIAADAVVCFQDNLARTARAAIVEGHTFPVSTLSNLAGKSLALFDPATVSWSPEVLAVASPLLDEYSGWFCYVPDGPEFVGFWAVSKQTGMLLGVLPDGSGGASQSSNCNQLNVTNKLFTALSLLATLAGIGGLGPFFFLGKQVAAIALLSAALLDNQDGDAMVGGDPNAAINGLAANAACEAAKLAVTTAAPELGNTIKNVVRSTNLGNSIGSLGGTSVHCPNALAGVGCG